MKNLPACYFFAKKLWLNGKAKMIFVFIQVEHF